jgi:hypothetical protein
MYVEVQFEKGPYYWYLNIVAGQTNLPPPVGLPVRGSYFAPLTPYMTAIRQICAAQLLATLLFIISGNNTKEQQHKIIIKFEHRYTWTCLQ